jgi:hypothetical protein
MAFIAQNGPAEHANVLAGDLSMKFWGKATD